MSERPNDPLEVADRLFRAIEAGDVDAVRDIYAPNAVVWHNFDQAEQTAEDNLRVLLWMAKNVSDRHYDVVSRQRTDEGFVQQHILRGTTSDGVAFAMPACILGRVVDGRIERIDEYLDGAQIATLFPARR